MALNIHFEDMDGANITRYDFGGVRRGSSKYFNLKVVNDANTLRNINITAPETWIYLSLLGVSWQNEVNFPLNSGEEYVVRIKLVIPDDMGLGSFEEELSITGRS